MMNYYYGDWTYIVLVLPAMLFALWASYKVNATFKKYSRQGNTRNITGEKAARFVLDQNGLQQIRIEPIAGSLTDHYDPSAQVIRLSTDVYNSTSSAAVGVACHEAGHAIQHAVGYAPIRIRTAIVPITNIGSRLSIPLIFAGLIISAAVPSFIFVAYAGVVCFALSTVFQLVTLPTEFDASHRALQCIEDGGLLYGDELKGAKRVLTAAAMTYVAALAVSLTQLLRLLVIVSQQRR